MARQTLLAVLLGGLISTLIAGGFWQKKTFEEWSQQEVVRMLTRSPWSRVVVVPISVQTASATDPTKADCPCGCGNSAVFNDAFRDGSEIDTAAAKNPKRVVSAAEVLARSVSNRSYTIRFLTARPIRMAMARYAVLSGRFNPGQAVRYVEESKDLEQIIVAVGCLESPPLELELPAEAFVGSAFFELKRSHTRIDFDRFISPSQTDQGEAMFFFPRYEDGLPLITKQDKEVLFFLRIPGTTGLEAKFKLKDMLINGELEL